MKLKNLALAAGTALALLTLNAQAQTATAPAAASPAMSAPAMATPPTDKAARKANRKANRALAKAVRKALVKDKSVDVTRVNVRARGGAITLVGSVPQQDQIEKAGQVAQGVEGVSSVKNALTVKRVGQ